MSTAQPQREDGQGTAARFHTTHWSVVLAAQGGKPGQAREALESLCRTYWFPLYAWARRQGHQPADAEDLTQGFMEHLLAHESFQRAREEKGRFRSYLLGAFKHYQANRARSAAAQKRGGGAEIVSLDLPAVEERYRREHVDRLGPDQEYDRRWAIAVIDTVLSRLAREAEAGGHGALFRQTKSSLLGEQPSPAYAELSRALGMSEGALRVSVHRLRQRYRELFLEEIAHTVSRPEEVPEEVAYLLRVVGG